MSRWWEQYPDLGTVPCPDGTGKSEKDGLAVTYRLTYHGAGMREERALTEVEKDERVTWWKDSAMRNGFAVSTAMDGDRMIVKSVTPKNMVWSYIIVEREA